MKNSAITRKDVVYYAAVPFVAGVGTAYYYHQTTKTKKYKGWKTFGVYVGVQIGTSVLMTMTAPHLP